jgi:hypothetical protein
MGHLAHLAIRDRFRSTRLRSCKAELRSSSPSPRWQLASSTPLPVQVENYQILVGDAKFVVYCGNLWENNRTMRNVALGLMHFSHSKDNTSIMHLIFFPACCVVASPCCRCSTEQIVVKITGLASAVPQNGTSFWPLKGLPPTAIWIIWR